MKDKTILLVEDNPDCVLLTRRIFKKNNFPSRLVVAQDGAEALDYLFATGAHLRRDPLELPSIILLDLNLPKIDGHEVLRRVRADARTQLLPVIILTSSQEESDMVRSYKLGANSYIRKPVDFAHFNEALRQLGSYWLSLNLSIQPTAES